jgi:fructose-1-phosphate kinase PfkB-like protein
VLAICDYGLGALDERVRDWLLAHRDAFALVALDAHELDRWAGLAPDVVTPSYAEARPLLGAAAGPEDARDSAAVSGGPALLRETGARTAAVTLDVSGAVVLTADGSYRTGSRPAPPSHCVGAGDAYLAAMLLALAVGADVPVAAELAQLAALATLGEPGTCVCSRAALLDAVRPDRPIPPPSTPPSWWASSGGTASAAPGSCSPTAASTCCTAATSATWPRPASSATC